MSESGPLSTNDVFHQEPSTSAHTTDAVNEIENELKRLRKTRAYNASTPSMVKLCAMLNVDKLIEEVERYIDQPIKIPPTMTAPQNRDRSAPGKAKRDLLSVEDIWESPAQQKEELSTLYNTSAVGERKWLLDMLLEESDPESGTEEEFTDEDIKAILKNHRDRRKYQKEYHGNVMNSQYIYYGSGLISERDRFEEHRADVIKGSSQGSATSSQGR